MKVKNSKILFIGDMHFGEHGDSEKFNQQVLEFVDWVCGPLKDEHGIETVVQVGDYFHHRNKVNVNTLNYGIRGARKLSETFGRDNVGVIVGNHDMFYLNDTEVNSLRAIEELVTVIDHPMMIGDNVLATPWVTGEQAWNDLVDMADDGKIDYIIGHFEFSGFKLNAGYEIETPYTHRAFKNKKRVITGHYHTAQKKDNVQYTGTPYPVSMNEANQDHGVWLLDVVTDELEFIVYDKIKVISIQYDELDGLDLEALDVENTSFRVEFPDDIDPMIMEETMEKLAQVDFQALKSKYTPSLEREIMEMDIGVEESTNIDEIVVKFIENINDNEDIAIDSSILADIYIEAMNRGEQLSD